MKLADFLAWERASRDTIDVKKCYIDIAKKDEDQAGDLVAGILLSQIIFWFLPDREGNFKVKVEKEGKKWLVKKRTDWWHEVRITARQYDRAVKVLEGAGLITVKLFKFDGTPTPHITVNWDVLLDKLSKVIDFSHFNKSVKSISTKCQNPLLQNVKIYNREYNRDYYRDDNTEATAETKKRRHHPPQGNVVVALGEIKDSITNETLKQSITTAAIRSALRAYNPEAHANYQPETPLEGIKRILDWMQHIQLPQNPPGFLVRMAREGMDKPSAVVRAEQAAEAERLERERRERERARMRAIEQERMKMTDEERVEIKKLIASITKTI